MVEQKGNTINETTTDDTWWTFLNAYTEKLKQVEGDTEETIKLIAHFVSQDKPLPPRGPLSLDVPT
jgi:hypothetical protein